MNYIRTISQAVVVFGCCVMDLYIILSNVLESNWSSILSCMYIWLGIFMCACVSRFGQCFYLVWQ